MLELLVAAFFAGFIALVAVGHLLLVKAFLTPDRQT